MKRKLLSVLLLASLLLFLVPYSASATAPVGQWWNPVLDSPEVYGGYVDLKEVYASCNGTHLFLLAQFYDSMPEEPGCGYLVYFYLDTDRNPETGCIWLEGAEIEVRVSSQGDSPGEGRLCIWSPAIDDWKEIIDAVEVVFEVGDDYVGAAVPLYQLGLEVGDTFDFIVRAIGIGSDTLNSLFTYTVVDDVMFMTIDGSPDGDWRPSMKKFTDPAGDFPMSEFDFTDLYLAASEPDIGLPPLYIRFDFASPPPVETLPEGSELSYIMYLYFDTDQNSGTGSQYTSGGESLGGIGADYRISTFGILVEDGKHFVIRVDKWDVTEWELGIASYDGAWGTIFEGYIKLRDLGITIGSSVDIYLTSFSGELFKQAPVEAPASYTIIVDETAPSISDVYYTPKSPTPDETVTVTAAVTDAESGVEMVEILYSTDDGATWMSAPMSSGSEYTGTIPEQAGGTTVTFKVKAEDYMGNTFESTTYPYHVETVSFGLEPTMLYILIGGIGIAVVVIVAIVLLKRRKPPMAPPPTAPAKCPNCGATLKPEAEFCPSCGKKIR